MRISEVVCPGRSRMADAPVPDQGLNGILVRVRACGVCGSEYPVWKTAELPPLRLGHEVAGEVAAVGPGVEGIAPGDRVTGLFRQGFAEYAAASASVVTRIPETLGFEEGALGEPLACAVSGALRTDVGLGNTVAVLGLGFMGLLTLQLLRMKGAFRILAVDTRPETEEAARRLGADEFYLPGEIPPGFLLKDSSSTGGVDVVAECSGNAASLNLAVLLLKRHSVLSIVGFHQGGPRCVDFQMLNWKAAEVVNAHEKRADVAMRCMKTGLDLAAAGRLEIAPLITHRYGLAEVDRAYSEYAAKPGGYVKAVVVP